jgi:hypothetical protein
MSVAYIPPTAGAVALGFAIPAAIVVDVADQLLATGTARHAYIGIQPATLTPEIARLLGINRTSGLHAGRDAKSGGGGRHPTARHRHRVQRSGNRDGGGAYSGTSRH